MKKIIPLLFAMSVPALLFAQQLPGTDIYLFDFSIKKKKVILNNPRNITNRSGYDNQPYFHPDKPILYYASANDAGRTDIATYNYQTKETKKLTTTPEREYSPTVTPNKSFISCIIQRDDGAQNLGKYPIDGGDPVVVISNLIVGYHTWVNENSLIAFILGQPNTLHFINLEKKTDTVLAQNIGRSWHKIPNENALSFTQRNEQSEWFIQKLDASSLKIETLTKCLPGNEPDITWAPDGKILASDKKGLFLFDPKKGGEWISVALPTDFNPAGISRLAINKKGDKLALVVAE